MKVKPAEVRKMVVAAVALLGQVAAAGVLTGTPLLVAQAVLLVAGAFGVYQVRNADPKPTA